MDIMSALLGHWVAVVQLGFPGPAMCVCMYVYDLYMCVSHHGYGISVSAGALPCCGPSKTPMT
eukprot:3580242-Karenia_brevis.AAC.1